MSGGGWLVYLLECRDGSLYAGITNDLPRRLAAHRSGKGSRYVAARLPCRVAWTEPAASRSAASAREAAIKRLDRRGKLSLVRRAIAASDGPCPRA